MLSVHAFGASAGDAVAPAVVGAMIVWAGWQHTALYGALPVFAVAALIFVALTSQDAGTRGGVARGLGLREYLRGIATLLRDRGVLGLSIMAGFRSMAQNGLLVFIPLYLVDVLGVGPLLLGVAVMVMQIGGMVAGPVAGTWSDRVGRRRIVLAGLTGTTVVVVLLTLAASEVVFIGGVAVLGFMLFAVRPVIHSWMMDITPPELSGSAVSALFGTQSAFSVAIPLVGGVIADAFGLPVVFYALAASMLVANTLVYLLPEAPCDSSR